MADLLVKACALRLPSARLGPRDDPAYLELRALRLAAVASGVPLPTVLVTVAVVVAVYLIGQLAYRPRHVLPLMVIAAFLALVLHPLVVLLFAVLRTRGEPFVVWEAWQLTAVDAGEEQESPGSSG